MPPLYLAFHRHHHGAPAPLPTQCVSCGQSNRAQHTTAVRSLRVEVRQPPQREASVSACSFQTGHKSCLIQASTDTLSLPPVQQHATPPSSALLRRPV
uniref:Uncharacterized protein n=1 Tax=Knipowitschia caucasica TaxID=637954 RepID=A0AAV2KYB7_KNICA